MAWWVGCPSRGGPTSIKMSSGDGSTSMGSMYCLFPPAASSWKADVSSSVLKRKLLVYLTQRKNTTGCVGSVTGILDAGSLYLQGLGKKVAMAMGFWVFHGDQKMIVGHWDPWFFLWDSCKNVPRGLRKGDSQPSYRCLQLEPSWCLIVAEREQSILTIHRQLKRMQLLKLLSFKSCVQLSFPRRWHLFCPDPQRTGMGRREPDGLWVGFAILSLFSPLPENGQLKVKPGPPWISVAPLHK